MWSNERFSIIRTTIRLIDPSAPRSPVVLVSLLAIIASCHVAFSGPNVAFSPRVGNRVHRS